LPAPGADLLEQARASLGHVQAIGFERVPQPMPMLADYMAKAGEVRE
jgi:hypothetical protein